MDETFPIRTVKPKQMFFGVRVTHKDKNCIWSDHLKFTLATFKLLTSMSTEQVGTNVMDWLRGNGSISQILSLPY